MNAEDVAFQIPQKMTDPSTPKPRSLPFRIAGRVCRIIASLRSEVAAWMEAALLALPGEIGILTRRSYYRATIGSIGKRCRLGSGFRVTHHSGLRIGDRVEINSAEINAAGGVAIGNNCLIACGVKIWSINHVYRNLSIPISHQGFVFKSVTIGDDVWLAANSVILPGVTIGEGSIIAAGAVVTKDVPSFSIAAGVPARVIGRRK